MRSFLISAFAILFFTAPQAFSDDSVTFEPAVATLSGTLLGNYVMLGSGQMLKGHVLYLNPSITINGNSESQNRKNRKTRDNIDRILLEIAEDLVSDDLMGASVSVSGALYYRPSDPHHTEILMIVDAIDVIDSAVPGEGSPVATFKTH